MTRPHDEFEIALAIERATQACAALLKLLDANARAVARRRRNRESDRTDRVLEAMGALRAARALTREEQAA